MMTDHEDRLPLMARQQFCQCLRNALVDLIERFSAGITELRGIGMEALICLGIEVTNSLPVKALPAAEIGRASCRERV